MNTRHLMKSRAEMFLQGCFSPFSSVIQSRGKASPGSFFALCAHKRFMSFMFVEAV